MQKDSETKMDTLRTRRAQISAQLLRLEAQVRTQARKEDTRRKILVGACLLEEMEENPKLSQWAKRMLSRRLTRPRDRALFGFGPMGSE